MIKLLEGVGSLARTSREQENASDPDSLRLGRAHKAFRPKESESVYLSTGERLRHTYILGATGQGKTKLIEFLLRQDILQGQGCALIDPHGDLYENILKFLAALLTSGDGDRIAEHISKKLILIEPGNEKWTVGFNPLQSKGLDPYKQALEFVGIFRKFWKEGSYGPRTEELLRHTLLTLSLAGLTLLEAKALLTDVYFRQALVDALPPGEAKEYWLYRYGQLSERMQATYREPILNRLSMFISDPCIRLMVGQAESTIDLRQAMDQGQWVLVNLSKGQLKGNADLLGAFMVAKLQLTALSRVDVPEAERSPFYLYVDEFQNFIGDDFETILSEARKYGLGLTIAHQNLEQINVKLRSAILGNVATAVFFRLSHHDATSLAAELSQKEKPMLQRRMVDLKVGEAYLKIKGEGPRLMRTMYVKSPKVQEKAIDLTRTLSLSTYARQRREVEAEIATRLKRIYENSPSVSVGYPGERARSKPGPIGTQRRV